jgi:transglutaminase-like putative cysteine protease
VTTANRWRNTATQRATAGLRELRLSGLLLIALAVATAGLHLILVGLSWWFNAIVVMIVVLGSAAAVRYLLRPRWLPTLVAAVVGAAAITVEFAGSTAVLGVIPTGDTVERFRQLVVSADDSIAAQSTPAVAVPGILFLICVSIAGMAILMDAVALWWRAPAVSGIPLLVVLAVPSIVRTDLADPVFFELTAVAYLFVIRVRIRRVQPAAALAAGAVAVLGALIVPMLLPPISPADDINAGSAGFAATVNPIINLGANLRKTSPVPALTYTTTADSGEYLQLTTLDSFDGNQWEPDVPKPIKGNSVSAIGAAPGLTSAVQRSRIQTTIQVTSTQGKWLPVPYPAKSITGLQGDWFWEPKALEVLSPNADMQGQRYTVTSLDVEPTQDQLEQAPRSQTSPLAKVPRGLDPIVAQTAKKMVGTAKTDFDKAIALQDWFRGGTFKYSVRAPAAAGFDGSGLDVIVPFLKAKSGYCVHFATTMAVMARTLGIPSRVAVGFLPGTVSHVAGEGTAIYQVSSTDLHAWPELYFKGVGWVRFEPTPSRGFEPNFASASVAQPVPADSAAPAPVPTATPTAPVRQPRLPADPTAPQAGASVSQSAPGTNWGIVALIALLLVLLVPDFVRRRIRRKRMEAIRNSVNASATSWREMRDTARDLGIEVHDFATTREQASYFEAYVSERLAHRPGSRDRTLAAIGALRSMIEADAYTSTAPPFPGERMASALRLALKGLRRSVPLASRLRAELVPQSVLDRLIGRTPAIR